MFDLEEFYRSENEATEERYRGSLSAVREICDHTANLKNAGGKAELWRFLNKTGKFILELAEKETKWCNEYFLGNSFDDLMEENNALFHEQDPENYDKSFLNPAWCAGVFGLEVGQLLCLLSVRVRDDIANALFHRTCRMVETSELFTDLFNEVEAKGVSYEGLRRHIEKHEKRDLTNEVIASLVHYLSKDFTYSRDIVMQTDLDNFNYLFMYGCHIGDYELQTAQFLQDYPEDKIEKIARQVVAAYERGFVINGKDPFRRPVAGIDFRVGQERIVREMVKALEDKGLSGVVAVPQSTRLNRQYDYDHRFDMAVWLDGEFVDNLVKCYQQAYEKCQAFLMAYSGTIALGQFGEEPYRPEDKKENLKLSDEQQELFQDIQNKRMVLDQKYVPRSETSFSMMAVPSPEIGPKYREIFEDILEVNMTESEDYEKIQQKIIDALDAADHVHVRGKNGNQTDLMVKLQKLSDPRKETNFVNCGADQNIPVGEVFTSPQLSGTDGVLHVGQTCLKGSKYVDLKLAFQDGCITDYSCRNFDDEDANRGFIEEGLLFPHKSLPMGEFAIGTNTLAYVIACKYGIMDLLPVLIIEKMGPHFSVGDTCFALEEDVKVFNPLDKKEIIARDNERSILRKEDKDKAYTYVHVDISLPYDEIGFVRAVTGDGRETGIIRNGRFALEGTEDLNRPFEG